MKSLYEAETLKDPTWMALRLVGTLPIMGEHNFEEFYWVWMFPPSRVKQMKEAIGSLAWGRMPWADALVETLGYGAIAAFCNLMENALISSNPKVVFDHVHIEKTDGSYAPEHTKHGFSAFGGRAETNIAPIAWATLKINSRSTLAISTYETAEAFNRIIAESYPEVSFLGPFAELKSLSDPYSGREELLTHIREAQAKLEAKDLSDSIKNQWYSSKIMGNGI